MEKLKVAELRQELQKRNLDSKGNKPALLDRLREAIKLEEHAKAKEQNENNTHTHLPESFKKPKSPSTGKAVPSLSPSISTDQTKIPLSPQISAKPLSPMKEMAAHTSQVNHLSPTKQISEIKQENSLSPMRPLSPTRPIVIMSPKRPGSPIRPVVISQTPPKQTTISISSSPIKIAESAASPTNSTSQLKEKTDAKINVSSASSVKAVVDIPIKPLMGNLEAAADILMRPRSLSPHRDTQIAESSPKISSPLQDQKAIKREFDGTVSSSKRQKTDQGTTISIRNFTRPLNIEALKEKLAGYGTVNRFWLDKFRTRCYVFYSQLIEAKTAKEALHDTKYQPDSGKVLKVSIVTDEEAEKDMKEEEKKSAPIRTYSDTTNNALDRYSVDRRVPLPEKSGFMIKKDGVLQTKTVPSVFYKPLPP